MLSIVIPTLNEENYIHCLLECLSKQTFKNFEVIMVDADSDDNTVFNAKRFNKKLDLRIFKSDKRNVSFQRNLGLKMAKYDIVLFLDADTSFDDYFLEKALKEMREKNVNIAGCSVYPDSNNLIDLFFFAGFRIFIKFFYKYIGFNGCCIFTLKSLHNKINGFDDSIKVGEDFDYVRRLKKITKIYLLNSVKIKTSVRRFEKNGRLNTGIKILLIGFYNLFIGKITHDLFKYRFNKKN